MDEIADNIFAGLPVSEELTENPSLLTVILEMNPSSWHAINEKISIQDAVKALVVFLNTQLSLNNSNQVAFIAALPSGARMLYPNMLKIDYSQKPIVNAGMYRHFRLVDDTILNEVNKELQYLSIHTDNQNGSTLSGALLMALTYTNRMLHVDQSISTTTASAINSTTSTAASGTTTDHSLASAVSSEMSARILVVTANDAHETRYIAIMNSIFAAQKMQVPIDVCKLGMLNSPYMQQAADATNGVYLHNREPRGLIQTLSTAYFVEPCLRQLVILPTSANVDYKASCFISGKPIDIGYICSVCLCILSLIPELSLCPVCKSRFDEKIVAKLQAGPTLRKKRKINEEAAT